MSSVPKCQALHIAIGRVCDISILKSNFCRFRCAISTLTIMLNFYGSFFYINICGFIGMGKFLYETRVLDIKFNCPPLIVPR